MGRDELFENVDKKVVRIFLKSEGLLITFLRTFLKMHLK